MIKAERLDDTILHNALSIDTLPLILGDQVVDDNAGSRGVPEGARISGSG